MCPHGAPAYTYVHGATCAPGPVPCNQTATRPATRLPISPRGHAHSRTTAGGTAARSRLTRPNTPTKGFHPLRTRQRPPSLTTYCWAYQAPEENATASSDSLNSNPSHPAPEERVQGPCRMNEKCQESHFRIMPCSGRRRSGKRNLGHGATGRPAPAQRHPRRKQPGRSAGQSQRHETGAVGSVPMPAVRESLCVFNFIFPLVLSE